MTALLLAALASASPVMLDIDGEASLTLDGFTRITPWTVEDPRVRWVEAPRRVRAATWPDPLLGDTVDDGTLAVRLPAGTYTLAALFDEPRFGYKPVPDTPSGLLTGDGEELLVQTSPTPEAFYGSRLHAHAPRPVFEPDGTRWDRQLAGRWRWRTETITVGDEELQLTPFGAPLAAVIITPADRATAEVELALVDARRRDWYAEHVPGLPADRLPWATEGLQGLEPLPWSARPGAPSDAPLDVALAPGERGSWMIAVHGSDAPAEVALEGLDGVPVQVHEVDWLDTQDSRLLEPRPHVVRPAEGRLQAGQGLVPVLALSVRLPVDTSPGTHTGALVVTRADEQVRLPITLRVRDLALEPTPVPFGVWADLDPHVAALYGPDSEEARADWARNVALMRAYDVDLVSLRGVFYHDGWPAPGRLPPGERLAWAAETWREAGGGPMLWGDANFLHWPRIELDPFAPAASAALLEASAEMMASAREADVEFYVLDEYGGKQGPVRHDAYRRFLDALDAVRPADGPALAAAEPYPGAWPLVAPRLDLIYLQFWPHLDPAHVDWFEGRRATPRSYTAFYSREAGGRIPWLLDTEAITVWHWGDFMNDPYNDAERGAKWHLALPSPDGTAVLPTRRLELLNAGVQDQRVLATVAALVDELADRRRRPIREGVAHACTLLRATASGLVGRLPKDNVALGLSDDQSLADLHDELADTAEHLARWSRRQRDRARGREVPEVDGSWPAACGPRPELRDDWRYPPR